MPDVAEPDLIGDDQPEVYDLICVGTGLGETMLAACVPPSRLPASAPRVSPVLPSPPSFPPAVPHALTPLSPPPPPHRSFTRRSAAKAGKSVLHLDPCEAYGGEWGVLAPDTGADGSSTFGWRLPPTPATPPSPSPSPPPSSPSPGEILLPALGAPARAFGPASRFSSSRGSIAPGGDLALAPNRFILDLAAGAKLATCASDPLVDALVASGAHKYVEFRSIARTWMYWDGAFAPVPASRAEVFRDATMAPGEKRALMRTLKDAVARAEAAGVAIGTGDPDDANRAIGAPGSEWKSATEKKDPAATTGPSVEESPEPKRERRSNDASSFAEDLASRGLSPRVAAATQYALALCDDASRSDAATGHDRLARYLVPYRAVRAGARRAARAAVRRGRASAGVCAIRRRRRSRLRPRRRRAIDPPRSRGGEEEGVGRKAGSRGADVLASPGCSPRGVRGFGAERSR